MSLRFINEKIMRELGLLGDEKLGEVWDKLEDGLVAFGQGKANLPLDSYLRSPRDDQFDRIISKSGVIEEVAGVKWIASAPLNTTKGLPRATGLLILNDIVTGFAYAVLDAVPVSNVRTGGCSMIFLKNFRPNFKRAVIFGAGVHGREHCRQLLYGRDAGHFPKLDEVAVFDLYSESSEKFAREFEGKVNTVSSLEAVAADDTAILYCTNALVPHVGPDRVKKFRALTANHMSLRDYTAEGLAAFDHIAADSAPHVARAKTSVDLAVQAGLVKLDEIHELPQLLIDQRNRQGKPFSDDQNVIFNPMGLGSHDLVLGRYVYEQAVAQGLGVELEYN